MDVVENIIGNESEQYGVRIAHHLVSQIPNWRELKNFKLLQEVDYQLKYRPVTVSLGIATNAMVKELKRIR